MKKNLSLIGAIFLIIILVSCGNQTSVTEEDVEIGSEATVEDKYAEEKGILSKDDAEFLVYNELNDDEKQKYTVDFVKEEGTKYFIRVYETVNGEIKVKKKFTVDYHTKEIRQTK
ncbi:hypothetical protein M3181_02590 [Mesobacillus maritimus]|uniref:hypothetical protein n=1 Tax=Mesobacillus maritimus TaxID=1643336 RepID=UPI0020411AE3|nr:hypothetical protein [Mesobacillus maritimus]MCM3667888.1 hypothetical protein [Mesobacillus maritimus]